MNIFTNEDEYCNVTQEEWIKALEISKLWNRNDMCVPKNCSNWHSDMESPFSTHKPHSIPFPQPSEKILWKMLCYLLYNGIHPSFIYIDRYDNEEMIACNIVHAFEDDEVLKQLKENK